jgi:hypothetical protein
LEQCTRDSFYLRKTGIRQLSPHREAALKWVLLSQNDWDYWELPSNSKWALKGYFCLRKTDYRELPSQRGGLK